MADSAGVVRELLRRFLRTRCGHVESVADGPSLRRVLERSAAPDLVVADTHLPSLSGLELLEEISSIELARPAVVLLTAHPDVTEETQASLGGAIGYVSKPIHLAEIDRAIALAGRAALTARAATRLRPLPVATALLLDAGAPAFALEVLDISETGALVATHASLDPGTRLDLQISLGTQWLSVEARVARVQEPNWMTGAGVAVEFVESSDTFRAAIRSHISAEIAARG
ncbi:MAG: response regulator [Myxococcota bacterium]